MTMKSFLLRWLGRSSVRLLPVAGLAVVVLTSGCQSTGGNSWSPKWASGKTPMQSHASTMASTEPIEEEPVVLSKTQQGDVQFAMGRSMEKSGDIEAAVKSYLEAAKLDPKRADIQLRLAVCFDRMGRFSDSKLHYEQAIQLDPGNPDIFCDMGYSLYLQKNFVDAERNLRQSLALKPMHTRSHNNLGLVLSRTGRTDEALMAFHRGGCSESQAHANIGVALLWESKVAEAHDHFQIAAKRDPLSDKAKQGLQQTESLMARLNIQPADMVAGAAPATQRLPAASAPVQVAKSVPPATTKTVSTTQSKPMVKPASRVDVITPGQPGAVKTTAFPAVSTDDAAILPAGGKALPASPSDIQKTSGVSDKVERIPAVPRSSRTDIAPATQPVAEVKPAPQVEAKAETKVEAKVETKVEDISLDFAPGAIRRDRYQAEAE